MNVSNTDALIEVAMLIRDSDRNSLSYTYRCAYSMLRRMDVSFTLSELLAIQRC
ncbi:hypothetical protein RMSM_00925 [Rhodopirellula maiorica SM1]|uniref:Uncharacterized protein n=1 Tax=Rhodopirellula maiorica SM1 TaxID=1265738 RepID=M5RS16_9BACT|nr:hypothetical protein [Rhodopirellula maiorica]EMI22138.1 hypothetical protein RMSM_00925 [Rhodopirellula maiorica SM1]